MEKENNNNNNNNYGDGVVCSCKCGGCHRKEGYFPPPGYKIKFKPSDQELVVDYLKKKLMNKPLPYNEIMRKIMVEVDLYNHHPEDLAADYKLGCGQKNWYFFTPTVRKYPNIDIPNRATGFGYWKSTGVDQVVKKNGVIVGYRRALVFHEAQLPKGLKTNWIMHEYRVTTRNTNHLSMTLDDWVLCKMYYKKDYSTRPKSKEEDPIAIMITEGIISGRM